MSDTLVRIPLTATSEFQPLALAPGLPMLDPKKLAYQVLLGWFGDLLAEPELDDDGVAFYVQKGGQRCQIRSRALATEADLNGPLLGDFDRLKKALFDVRPVSPSERLIFNRLQPPIANHTGYLYRVHESDGAERLVWCWGFQRRTSEGRLRLCPNLKCSALFLERDEEYEECPYCGELLRQAPYKPVRRSRPPFGAVAAGISLIGLACGTYFFGGMLKRDAELDEPLIAGLDSGHVQAAEREQDFPPPTNSPSTELPSNAAMESLPQNRKDTVQEPRPLFAHNQQVDVTPITPEFAPSETVIGPLAKSPPGADTPQPPSTPVDSDAATTLPNDSAESLPITPPLPDPVRPQPVESADPSTSIEKSPATVRSNSTFEPSPGTDTQLERSSRSSKSPESLEQPEPPRTVWHNDYVGAYQKAVEERRQLLMLFENSATSDNTVFPPSDYAKAELRDLFEEFVCVRVSVDFESPRPPQDGAASRLLEHRSFRHLGGLPGIAIIELRDPSSPHFGRVISALPLGDKGRYAPETIGQLLQLPGGNIGQRSLILAVRSSLPEGNFAANSPHPLLNQLAARMTRSMNQSSQADSQDQETVTASVSQNYGQNARVRTLRFATDGASTIQEASIQAVRAWLTNPGDFAALREPATAYGLDLYQLPSDGRWFAVCLIVNQ